MYDEKFMTLAIEEAEKAFNNNEVPVGAIVVYKNKVIGTGYNKKKTTNCVYMHAELIAVKEASNYLKDWRLNDCDIYITLEPCSMCCSAIKESRIKNIYYGCERKDKNLKKINKLILDKNVNYININENKCSKILSSFFENKR